MWLASEAGETKEGVESGRIAINTTSDPITSHPHAIAIRGWPQPCRGTAQKFRTSHPMWSPVWSSSEEPTSPSLARQAQKRLACAVQPQSGPLLAPARLGSNFTLCNFFSELSKQAASPSYK